MWEYADEQSVLDLQHTERDGWRYSWEYGEFRLSLSDIGTVTGGRLCVCLSRGVSAQARIPRGRALFLQQTMGGL